jgi:diadenosine tetraphosphate (Ap4A) HIT family hydrolase
LANECHEVSENKGESTLSQTDPLQAFQAKFRVAELLVLDSGAWSWSVRPGQPTLGAGVLSLNRHALQLSDVSASEMAQLAGLIRTLEQTMKAVFDYNIMNYLMLMMVDHQVHYHVIPRYDGIRQFAGLAWLDNGWPGLPVLGDSQHSEHPEILASIQQALITASSG